MLLAAVNIYELNIILTHQCLKVPLEIVLWIQNDLDNNFGIGNDLTKYSKESCW